MNLNKKQTRKAPKHEKKTVFTAFSPVGALREHGSIGELIRTLRCQAETHKINRGRKA